MKSRDSTWSCLLIARIPDLAACVCHHPAYRWTPTLWGAGRRRGGGISQSKTVGCHKTWPVQLDCQSNVNPTAGYGSKITKKDCLCDTQFPHTDVVEEYGEQLGSSYTRNV